MNLTRLVEGLFITQALANPLLRKSVVVTIDTVTTTISDSPWRHIAIPVTQFQSFVSSIESATLESQTSTSSALPTQSLTISVSESSSTAASNSPSTLDSYAQPILDQHNNHRLNSSAPALTWSDGMASIAAEIAASCVYAHNVDAGGGGYGQNIGAGAEPSAVPALITNQMYDSEIDWYPTPYGSKNPDLTNFDKWGHYSQIVWASTTSVGCATQYCPNGLANTDSGVSPYFTVCNYRPPGNLGGHYSNVGAPSGNVPNVVMR